MHCKIIDTIQPKIFEDYNFRGLLNFSMKSNFHSKNFVDRPSVLHNFSSVSSATHLI